MKELYAALFAAQAEFPKIKRDSKNPHFKSKYASLAGAAEQLEPILRKHDLLVTQPACGNGVGTGCTSILAHVPTGQEIRETLLLPSAGPGAAANAQTGTAAVTYAKRVGYISIVGAIVEDDDDGEKAVGRGPSAKRTEPAKKADTKQAAAPAASTKQKTSEPAKPAKEPAKTDPKATAAAPATPSTTGASTSKSARPTAAPASSTSKVEKSDGGGEPEPVAESTKPPKAEIPTELPGTSEASVYPNEAEYQSFKDRAQAIKGKLATAGVATPGAKLSKLFLTKANVEKMELIPKLSFEAMLKKLEKMVDDPKLIQKAIEFVERGY